MNDENLGRVYAREGGMNPTNCGGAYARCVCRG